MDIIKFSFSMIMLALFVTQLPIPQQHHNTIKDHMTSQYVTHYFIMMLQMHMTNAECLETYNILFCDVGMCELSSAFAGEHQNDYVGDESHGLAITSKDGNHTYLYSSTGR